MQKFVFLPHTADAKFQAYGKTLEECFSNSALAMNSVECDLKRVGTKQKIKISVSAPSAEELLHKFLEEILFQMDTRQMLFSKIKIKIDSKKEEKTKPEKSKKTKNSENQNQKKFLLKAELFGERINKKKHAPKTLIKAVTWNNFFLRKEGKKWIAQALCDT